MLLKTLNNQIRIRNDDAPLTQFVVAINGASWKDPYSIALMVIQAMLGSWNKRAGAGKHMGDWFPDELRQAGIRGNEKEPVDARGEGDCWAAGDEASNRKTRGLSESPIDLYRIFERSKLHCTTFTFSYAARHRHFDLNLQLLQFCGPASTQISNYPIQLCGFPLLQFFSSVECGPSLLGFSASW
ncbi:hypothetical protein E3N88_13884 [Mikania micrantha]|uniref:Uncharacterized protein n=1 Tax=Mikania micrantha TaxID=192012 RepID=A0A5N6NZW1_9ASTR|nr:hypothetical protein E3N88_13884 [Mikania micrantha]